MNDILKLSLLQVKKLLDDGNITSVNLTKLCLERIEETKNLNTFITVCAQEALKTAAEIDKKRAEGKPLGALAGIPIAIKDNISTKGIRTTCASKFLDNYIPPFDASVVTALKAADAVIVGKTNMDEFAMGSGNENSAYGAALNAANPAHVPGGSSGGSASCVAAYQVYAALGSDTGGSIRQPAAYCGVVGLKPTYSAVSRFGLVAFASSLDQIGPLTRTTADAAYLMNVISFHDKMDTTSYEMNYPNYTDYTAQLKGKVVGIANEFFSDALDGVVKASVMSAVNKFESMGATVRKVGLGSFKAALATYYVLSSAEAATNLSRFDGVKYGMRENADDINNLYTLSRSKYFGDEVKRRIMIGNYVLSSGYYDAYYLKALKVRTLIKDEFNRALDGCDVLACPVAPTTAPMIGVKETDTAKVYLSDIYTVPVNIAGLPAISFPCGKDNAGLPIGIQLIAKAFDEKSLFSFAQAFEKESLL